MAQSLKIGFIHQSIMDEDKLVDPSTKHYTSRYPNQTLCMPDGSEVIFVGKVFSTQDPDVIASIEAAIKSGGSMLSRGRTDVPEPAQVLSQGAEDNATLAKVAASADAGIAVDPATMDAATKVADAMKTK